MEECHSCRSSRALVDSETYAGLAPAMEDPCWKFEETELVGLHLDARDRPWVSRQIRLAAHLVAEAEVLRGYHYPHEPELLLAAGPISAAFEPDLEEVGFGRRERRLASCEAAEVVGDGDVPDAAGEEFGVAEGMVEGH